VASRNAAQTQKSAAAVSEVLKLGGKRVLVEAQAVLDTLHTSLLVGKTVRQFWAALSSSFILDVQFLPFFFWRQRLCPLKFIAADT